MKLLDGKRYVAMSRQCWVVDLCCQLCAMVSVDEEQRELVKTGCPKSAQEIWPCFVQLEGQGASLLAFVGSLTCYALVRMRSQAYGSHFVCVFVPRVSFFRGLWAKVSVSMGIISCFFTFTICRFAK